MLVPFAGPKRNLSSFKIIKRKRLPHNIKALFVLAVLVNCAPFVCMGIVFSLVLLTHVRIASFSTGLSAT